MKFSLVSLFTKLTLATSLVGTLASCDEPKYPEPSPATAPSAAQARFQVINVAPGANNLQLVSIDNVALTPAFAALPYLNLNLRTAAYTNIQAGPRLLTFTEPSNAPGPDGPRPVLVRSTFASNTSSTVFLTDAPTRPFAVPVTATSDRGGIRSVVLTDDLTAPAAGRARVRFINLSPSLTASGTGGLGLFNTATNSFLFDPTGRNFRSTTFTPVAVPGMPAPVTTNFATFTDIAAGPYTVDVRATATTAPRIASQVLTFASGKIYTVYTRGVTGSAATPLGITVLEHN